GRAYGQYRFTALEDINPAASNVVATDINNRGQIVGLDQTSFTGFLLSGTSYTHVGPGAIASQAWGINDAGDIVGNARLTRSLAVGFLYRAGNYSPIIFPDSNMTFASGINNSGVIVGNYGPPTEFKGFLLNNGATRVSAYQTRCLRRLS